MSTSQEFDSHKKYSPVPNVTYFKTLLKNPNGKAKAKSRKKYHVLTAVTSSESVIVPMNMKIGKNLFALLINAISEKCKRSLLTKAAK